MKISMYLQRNNFYKIDYRDKSYKTNFFIVSKIFW